MTQEVVAQVSKLIDVNNLTARMPNNHQISQGDTNLIFELEKGLLKLKL